MNLYWLLLAFASCISFLICSEDTLETKIKSEVLIESERVRTQKSYTLSTLKIDLNKFFHKSSTSHFEILSLFPGIYIRDYGGFAGIKLISHRGLAATDVAILLDGAKINNQQNGVLDLSLIPIDAFQEVELIKGGAATIYGNNSTSGLLNFSFNQTKSNHNIKFSFGNFNSMKLNSLFSFHFFTNLNSNIGFSIYKSDGNFPIEINEFGITKKIKRENNKINAHSFYLTNLFETKFFVTKLNFLFTHSTRGVPGAVLQNNIENKTARLTDDLLFLNLKIIPIFFEKNFVISAKALLTKNRYLDPQVNLLLLGKETAEYNNEDIELRLDYQKHILSFFTKFFIETNFASFTGDMLATSNNNSIQRTNFATGLSLVKFYNSLSYLYCFEVNLRYDVNNYFRPIYSSSLGFSLTDTVSKLFSKLNLSTNFRLPTFNELFYLNYGNQNLRPEHTNAINFEVGINLFDLITPTFSLFYYFTRDKIISVPKSPVQWSAMNISRTQSKGFEFAITSKTKSFECILSYSYTSATDYTQGSPTYGKQLVYTPKHIGNLFLSLLVFNSFTLSSKLSYVGKRYSLPDNSQKSQLTPYALLDIILSKKFNLTKYSLFVNLEILNFLDTNYEIILNYPMPGRYFVLTISTNF